MTFKKFEELFATKYPMGEVFAHGTFSGTEDSGKTTVCFAKGGKAYKYYGSYEVILEKIGIDYVSEKKVAWYKEQIARLESMNGEDSGFDDEEPMDFTEEIERLKKELAELTEGKIVA